MKLTIEGDPLHPHRLGRGSGGPEAVKSGVPLAYLAATGLLMLAAVMGRERQLARL